MMKKSIRISFWALAALCMFAGCSDDSNKNKSDGTQPGTPQPEEKCGETKCVTGQICQNDKCVTLVEDGAVCNDTDLICHNGKCTDGVCVHISGECTSDSDCTTGGTCQNGKCMLKVGDACQDTEAECADSVCYNGTCSTTIPCENSDICGDFGYCDTNSGQCEQYPKIGEKCDSHGCGEDLECIDEVCVINDLAPGNDCDDHHICEITSWCEKGKCITNAMQDEECDEYRVCAESLACDKGKCISTLGECTKDEDCGTDSYCCTEAACDVKNKCYAYGTGPRDNINEECVFKTVKGMFEASVQCTWSLKASSNDASTVLVADTPFDSNGSSEIIARMDGSIRIFNAETCEELQAIPNSDVGSGSDQISLADLDGDGKIEIISNSHDKITTFKWDDKQKKYVNGWTSSGCGGKKAWGGASIHDINGDGKPEILYQQYVLQGEDGKCLNPKAQNTGFGGVTIAGDLDLDGSVEAITSSGIVRWDSKKNSWEKAYDFAIDGETFAFADFGTPGDKPESFDFTKLDGKAEVVASGESISIYTLSGQKVFTVNSGQAGAPTIGDFDADKLPEIAVGGKNKYSVFDPQCTEKNDKCQDKYTLWSIKSQDADNTVSSSSLFDFDGDGQAEVVYSDECFTRILDGKNGEVLFSSYRMSKIDREYPTISDMDKDESVEIVIMANSVAPGCTQIDELHHGVKCVENGDCFSQKCVDGYCRCTSDDQCNWQYDSEGKLMQQYQCTTPLAPQKESDGKVCRAYHRNGDSHQGLVVLRDRLDRWVSSRDIWNQHAFSITNINPDGSVPALSSWKQNFTDATMNNYRKNIEGVRGANTAPDITGKFTDAASVCGIDKNGTITLNAVVCNRGTKMVARKMPATFYQIQENGDKTLLCTSYTTENVPIGGCLPVSCEIQSKVSDKILLVVNDDGKGGKTTVECNESNNTDEIEITGCEIN